MGVVGGFIVEGLNRLIVYPPLLRQVAHIHFRGTEPRYACSYYLVDVVQCLSCREPFVHKLNILRHESIIKAAQSQTLLSWLKYSETGALYSSFDCWESAGPQPDLQVSIKADLSSVYG